MEPEQTNLFEKIRPFLSRATFIILVIAVGFLSINFILALIQKLS